MNKILAANIMMDTDIYPTDGWHNIQSDDAIASKAKDSILKQ